MATATSNGGFIEAVKEGGVTAGCNPPTNDSYCPVASITRSQMAAFLATAVDIPATGTDYFADDAGSVFEAKRQPDRWNWR